MTATLAPGEQTATATTATAAAPSPSVLEIRPFDAPLGAEVLGLDLSQPLSTADFSRIHRAHLDHHVLVFRDQRITPRQVVDQRQLRRPVVGKAA